MHNIRGARALDRSTTAIGVVLVLAAALRLVGLDWDAGTHQHPDERHISDVMLSRLVVPPDQPLAEMLDPAVSQLNPRSADPRSGTPRQFAYGSLPLLLTEAVACALDTAGGRTCAPGGAPGGYWTSYEHEYLVGRGLTVLADLVLILISALIARRAFGPLAAIGTALFLAVSAINIQLAHFFATDTWSALFAMGALWALARAADDGPLARWHHWVWAGLFAGASVASKANTAVLVVPALAALWFSTRGAATVPWSALTRRALVLLVSTVLSFAVLEPFALPSLASYLRDLNEQANILGSGNADVPYTRQFVGTLPVLHYLWNLWGYGLGPGLTLLGLAGMAPAARRLWRGRAKSADIVLLVWFVAYGTLINTVFAKFLRYTLPLVPVLAIFGGALFASAVTRLRLVWRAGGAGQRFQLRQVKPLVLPALAPLALLLGLVQALLFVSLYFQPYTRVAASEWIYANVPEGSRIAAETWDDSLPLGLDGSRHPGAYRYRFVEANHYHDRSPEQGAREILRIVRDSDYIILASQRVYFSTRRLPWRYPVVNRYYDLLFSGRLGFDLVYASDVQPRLGPLRLDSRLADESFSVYDHPPVWVFKKRATLGAAHIGALLGEATDQSAPPTTPAPKDRSLLLNEPTSAWPDLSTEPWAAPPGNSWLALFLWLVVLALLCLAVLPIAVRLFGPLIDGGIGLLPVLALLLVAYPAWAAASYRWLPFTAVNVTATAVAVGLFAWLALPTAGRLRGAVAGRRAAIVTTGAVALVAFLVGLMLRLANPDLWEPWLGGEKPLEGAFLGAVMRSAYFPPYDPWFAGGYINYYYFGFVLISVPMKIAGIAPTIGFNLAVATLYAIVAAAMASIGQGIAGGILGRDRVAPAWQVSASGVAAAVLMVGIGNLDGAVQAVNRFLGTTNRFDFWQSSRVTQFVITEFPYFSFLFADLHAHLIAMPLAALVAGTALALVLRFDQPAPALAAWRRVPWDLLALAALALGGLACTNAWDVPAYTAVLAGGLFLGSPFPRREVVRRALWAASLTALVAAGLALLYWPFFQNFQSFYGSLGATRIPTQLHEFVTIWGYLLTGLLLVLIALLFSWRQAGGPRRHRWWLGGISLVVGLALGSVLPRGIAGAVITLPLLALVAAIWIGHRLVPAAQFVLMLFLGALGVITGVEFVFLVDFLEGGDWYRMNTVFKLYLEAWLMLAAGLGGGLALVLRDWRRLPATYQGAAATLAGLGLAASLAYPLLISSDRLSKRFPEKPGLTLDGLAYMETATFLDNRGALIALDEDLQLIHWLQSNARGNPVIAEAAIGPYRGDGSRISNATGLATILGWDNHEGQQRWPKDIPPRVSDVRAIYTSRQPDEVLALLERYDVSYIVVGQVERKTSLQSGQFGARRTGETYATPEGLATLQELERRGVLVPAFQAGETTLYQVVRPFAMAGDR